MTLLEVRGSNLRGLQRYRGRFAPSPTGPLHLGSLYTALAGFLQAKSNQGEWLLRVDDADLPRVTPGATDCILRALERFGLTWDGSVVLQSHKLEAYQAALRQLDDAGWLYACTCSRKTLSALPRRSLTGNAPYPGTCRFASHEPNQAHALRVVTEGSLVSFEDKLQGPQQWDIAEEFGDFIVFRRDGIVAYHLATVIDDWQAGVTEVLRGCDLLESTPLQIHLQQLLGLPTPVYRHIPIIVDCHGIKLSKQNLAMPVTEGNPSRILSLLLGMLGLSPPEELRNAPPAEIIAWAVTAWDISRLSGKAVDEPEEMARECQMR